MPSVMLERPKMSRAMWEGLKNHIMKERQKKKQELEADAEVERQRKEREIKQKQDVTTLEETKEQIAELETKLSQLKEEKHQLFLQLKKVLNEDETRRRQFIKESNDMMANQTYPHGGGHHVPTVQIAQPAPPPVFLQPGISIGGGGRAPIYKVQAQPPPAPPPQQQQQSISSVGALKRNRSPSPPSVQSYHQGYSYKTSAVNASYAQQKSSAVTNHYPSSPFYVHTQQSQPPISTSAVSYATQPTSQAVYTYPSGVQSTAPGIIHDNRPPGATLHPHPQSLPGISIHPSGVSHSYAIQVPPPPPGREDGVTIAGKHLSGVYLTQHVPGQKAYVSHGHQTIDVKGQPAFQPVQESEKFYGYPAVPTVSQLKPGSHGLPVHPVSLPLQVQITGPKTGSITSGYPIRVSGHQLQQQQPPVSSVTAVTYQHSGPNVSTPHSIFVTQASGAGPHLLYTHPQHHPGQPGPGQLGGPPPPGSLPPGRYVSHLQ